MRIPPSISGSLTCRCRLKIQIFWIESSRKSIGSFFFYFLLQMNYLLLACGSFTANINDNPSDNSTTSYNIFTAASWFGILAGAMGYILAITELLTKASTKVSSAFSILFLSSKIHAYVCSRIQYTFFSCTSLHPVVLSTLLPVQI
jgi:hypothetical protein